MKPYAVAFLLLFSMVASTSAETLDGTKVQIEGAANFIEYDDGQSFISKNISGAECVSTDFCIAVSDETRFIQKFQISSGKINIGSRLYLKATKDDPDKEKKDFDIESLAVSGTTFLAVGSHSWARKKCKPKKRNQFVFFGDLTPGLFGNRVPITQPPVTLTTLFEHFPVLDHFNDAPVQRNGMNIEGSTIVGDQVFLGFRAPYIEGTDNRVLIASLSYDDLVSGIFENTKLSSVKVEGSPGQGIRGMTTLGEDIILLIGDSGASGSDAATNCSEPSPHLNRKYSVHFYSPGEREAEYIGNLRVPEEGWKAETILVDPSRPIEKNKLPLLVFFDGASNGGPHSYLLSTNSD